MIGIVKWFSRKKGYGFITPSDGSADIFVHISTVEALGLKLLVDGNVIEYDIGESKNGNKMAAFNLLIPKLKLTEDSDFLKQYKITIDEINENLIFYLSRHPNEINSLSSRKFEVLIAELLFDMGYDVTLTSETKDGGRDILAVLKLPNNQELLTIVECKKYDTKHKIGIATVQRFMWVLQNVDKANKGMIVTTSSFSKESHKLQQNNKWLLSLEDNTSLKNWLEKYGSWKKTEKLGIWLPNNSIS